MCVFFFILFSFCHSRVRLLPTHFSFLVSYAQGIIRKCDVSPVPYTPSSWSAFFPFPTGEICPFRVSRPARLHVKCWHLTVSLKCDTLVVRSAGKRPTGAGTLNEGERREGRSSIDESPKRVGIIREQENGTDCGRPKSANVALSRRGKFFDMGITCPNGRATTRSYCQRRVAIPLFRSKHSETRYNSGTNASYINPTACNKEKEGSYSCYTPRCTLMRRKSAFN